MSAADVLVEMMMMTSNAVVRSPDHSGSVGRIFFYIGIDSTDCQSQFIFYNTHPYFGPVRFETCCAPFLARLDRDSAWDAVREFVGRVSAVDFEVAVALLQGIDNPIEMFGLIPGNQFSGIEVLSRNHTFEKSYIYVGSLPGGGAEEVLPEPRVALREDPFKFQRGRRHRPACLVFCLRLFADRPPLGRRLVDPSHSLLMGCVMN